MIVLASKSPRRRMLLEREISKDFLTHSPDIDEDLSYTLPTPLEAVRDIAKRKCESCISLFKDDLIISADTIVVLGNEIIHKPADADDVLTLFYDASGNMIGSVNGATANDGHFTIDAINGSAYARIFFWDSLNNIQPVAGDVVVRK